MTDQRLRDGGPWALDDPEVTLNGYFETWGAQESTAFNGPTVDGLTHGRRPGAPPGTPRQGGLVRIQEDDFR